jgi:hypothetical protein
LLRDLDNSLVLSQGAHFRECVCVCMGEGGKIRP